MPGRDRLRNVDSFQIRRERQDLESLGLSVPIVLVRWDDRTLSFRTLVGVSGSFSGSQDLLSLLCLCEKREAEDYVSGIEPQGHFVGVFYLRPLGSLYPPGTIIQWHTSLDPFRHILGVSTQTWSLNRATRRHIGTFWISRKTRSQKSFIKDLFSLLKIYLPYNRSNF